ncbi:MAG: Piwi domain-containing protein [Bacteroidota bacterium]|nr:Piwi domain-containing protein [Bacteroidota bacterium]
MQQNLILNIIPFNPPVQQVSFPFYKEYKEGYCPCYIDDVMTGLLDGKMSKLEQVDTEWLYTDFKEPQDGALVLDIDITVHTDFAAHYYRHLVFTYFKGVSDIMHRNFTKEVEVWFLNEGSTSDKYKVYGQYTLKVQHSKVTNGPELVVSFDGKTKVYKKSLSEMVGVPTGNFNWMNCNGILHKWDNLPPDAKLNLDKVFPVISNKLKPELGIRVDTPDLTNRYPKYFKALNDFYSKYLDNKKFRSVIPISAAGFMNAPAGSVEQIHGDSNKLQFGKDIGTEPKTDLKRLGPFKPVPPPNNVKFFFIYQKADKPLCDKLKEYFLNGYKYHPNMQAFIHQPFSFDESLDISFDSIDTAVTTIWNEIKDRSKHPDTKYFAIYVSPVAKFETNFERKRIYYRVKEMLLNESYLSQVIFKENVSKESFNFFLPNIQIAILAKLGGIPWRLSREPNDELIVGIGAFYSQTLKTRYVGSAFCFNNEGEFKGFDCFGSADTISLAGSIREAVTKFLEINKNASRLIIHFYKVMSKRKLKPILDTLYNSLNLSTPVIIVTINKTASKELLAFYTAHTELMPISGTYIRVAEREYLLFNNTRYNETSKPTAREYHFPVKIKFTSTHLELLEDIDLVNLLIDQVYQFSRMYWKSVSQQNLPVTIKYPEVVAEIYPYFKYDKLPEFGKENLWFL